MSDSGLGWIHFTRGQAGLRGSAACCVCSLAPGLWTRLFEGTALVDVCFGFRVRFICSSKGLWFVSGVVRGTDPGDEELTDEGLAS